MVDSFPFVGMCLLMIEGVPYVETAHNDGVGFFSCAVRCLLWFSMKSQYITHLMRLEA